MPKLTIDGKEYEARAGQTVIQVIYENNLDLPHFCWHPALPVAGNCRMCLVEIEKMPKLAIACATIVSEGMVVNTQSSNATKGREDVMEFLLINHPLDCPICDEAGQCKLQDYAFSHSRGESRFEEVKNHKDKRVAFGPNVLFDGERCISCSRCIRFGEEIAEQPILSFVHRGDHVSIETFPGTQLDNPISMNVIDICPVGALTSRDFRFKARAWDMSFTDTVCPGCANGCNIRVGVRDNEILRLEPRPNPNVNDFWMCDEGRLNAYPSVNADDRVSGAFEKKGNTHIHVDLSTAVTSIASALKKYKADEIAFIASAYATLEDNFVFAELAKTKGIKHIGYFTNEHGNDEKLLIKRDKTPNVYALKLLGIQPFNDDFAALLRNGRIKAVYSLEDDFLGRNTDLAIAFGKVAFFATHATNIDVTAKGADVILPASAWAEKEGVFINAGGWINLLKPAVATTHTVRGFDHLNQSRLDKYGTQFDRWAQGRKVDALESWRLTQMIAVESGNKTDYRYTEDVFEAVIKKLPKLLTLPYADGLIEKFTQDLSLNYDKLGSEGLPVNGIGRERKPIEYREVYQESTEAQLV